MTDIKKISNDIIEKFEKHYKENVIQPIITVNAYGEIISYIYSIQSDFKGKNYKKRVYEIKTYDGHNYLTSKYRMVYMEIPNNKQIRYDYMFYNEQHHKHIQTFAIV